MIEVKQVPLDSRHNLALTERQAAVGQLTRVPIAAGEQVLRNKVADQVRDVGFSANIPQGKRAVAVGVTEVIATGGHIGVGDFVDVIGVFEVYDPSAKNTAASGQSEKAKPFVSVTILQNIQVLAVAQQSEPTIESSAVKDSDRQKVKVNRELKSVTLALTPEQAEKLFLAEEIGTLRLSLRPFGEDEQRKIAPVTNDLPSIVG
jgi:pilus assembly protein CpaB